MKKFLPIAIALIIFFNANAQSGSNCSSAIPIIPTATCSPISYTTTDSVVYLSFVANQKYAQIVGVSSVPLGTAAPHIHRLTLFSGSCSTLQIVEDEFLPNIIGATELQIDASNLTIGNTYYVRFTREPSRASAGCAPTPSPTGECHASMSWNFTFCISSPNILIPKDFNLELPAKGHSYYTGKGQITDFNNNPRHDIKCYAKNSTPEVYIRDTAISFVFRKVDTIASTTDSLNRVDMTLVASNTNIRSFKTEKVGNYLNYFLGHVPDGAINIKGYSRDVINNVYPNIDMQFYSNNVGTKFYFIIRPGGNGDTILMNFAGANSVTVNANKGVDIQTVLGKISFEAGHAYQINPAGNIVPMPWQANFIQVSQTSVKLDIRSYPTNLPLFIQIDQGHKLPVPASIGNLQWSTYYGGNYFQGLTVNSKGVYLTGTASNNFPTKNALYGNFLGSNDATMAKFTLTDSLLWATYYGGNDIDMGFDVAVEPSGDAYFVGKTSSTNFPPSNPMGGAYFQGSIGSAFYEDGFIVKLNSAGNTQLWSTYYGGNYDDRLASISIDTIKGNLFIAGRTNSTNYPVLNPGGGAYIDSIWSCCNSEITIHKFNKLGQRKWATLYGGNSLNVSANPLDATITYDYGSFIYVTGTTADTNFPVLPYTPAAAGQYNQPNLAGATDAALLKFDTLGIRKWATYYGGKLEEEGQWSASVDNNRSVYFTGRTYSTDFPTKQNINLNSYNQSSLASAPDAYILKFSATGARDWATYFGGNNADAGLDIVTDGKGYVYLTGFTQSSNLPLPYWNFTNGGYIDNNLSGSVDAFIAAFNPAANYVWGTYYGGANADYGFALAEYKNSSLYLAGNTYSTTNFPLVMSPFLGGYFDTIPKNTYVARFDISTIILADVNEFNNSSEGNILIYPNPSNGQFIVQFENQSKTKTEIIISNILGENVFSEKISNAGINKIPINISSIVPGIYLLQIKTDEKVISKKFIKQ